MNTHRYFRGVDMFKIHLGVVIAGSLTALALIGTNALAADDVRDFSTNTCKDIMRLSGQDRDVALALAHGYVLGKKGTTKYEIDVLAGITDRFIDYCLDNPKANALESFEKVAR
jgi:hypothetical protein